MLGSKVTMMVASFFGLFLISAGVSLLVFSYVVPKLGGKTATTTQKTSGVRLDLSLPKTEACPINGALFTKPEKDDWMARRPVATMIENSLDARPQSGLSRADVVYEAVAEGGITRFLAIFYCNTAAQAVKAAPIRSARIYFVNMAAGYGTDPVYLHQGGANNFCNTCPGGVKTRGQVLPKVDAYAALDKLGWRNGAHGNDMDGGFNIGYPIVVRDQYRLGGSTPAAWEHSVVASIDEVYKEAAKRGFEYKDENGVAWTQGFTSWKFEDGKAIASPTATDISFKFWDGMGDYDVEWKYDAASNSYLRFNGGKPHTDLEFDKPQIKASNVIVMFAKETGPVDPEKHMFYEVIGTGDALIFKNGEVITGTWKKVSQLDREVFYDKTGNEVTLSRGPVWVEIVPATNQVNY